MRSTTKEEEDLQVDVATSAPNPAYSNISSVIMIFLVKQDPPNTHARGSQLYTLILGWITSRSSKWGLILHIVKSVILQFLHMLLTSG